MKKIVILTMALIMVIASAVNVFAAGTALYLSTLDEIGSTSNPTSWPFIPIGKWANGDTMYMKTYYDPTNPLRGYYWTYNKGLFEIDTARAEAYSTHDMFLIQGSHPETTVTAAWKLDDIPIIRPQGGIYTYNKSNKTWVSTSWTAITNGREYKGYKIMSSDTSNVTGYGKALGFGLANGVSSFNTNKFIAIEGNFDDMCAYIDNLENAQVGGNGLTGIVNPTFLVKAGYGLILELDGTNTLGIAQYIDMSSTPAKAPLFGKWITGASEHFSNNFQYVYDSKNGTEINFTRENGGVLKSATKGSHYTDMGAASNYKYYLLLNPPTNWKGDNVDYTIPVTVKVTGTVKRAIVYPTTYEWTNDTVYFDTESERAPITYIDNNGELEQREITGNLDINSDNPDINLNTDNIGGAATQVDINNDSVGNAISGINDLINQNNDSSNKISEQFKEFFSNLKGIYTWLPTEVFNICIGMFSIVLAIYVIKLFR